MAAPCVEVNITTKDGKSSKMSESVANLTGNITLPALHQGLSKMQVDVNSYLTTLVEAAKKSGSATATGAVGNSTSDNDELDEDSEEDEEDEREPGKRKSSQEVEKSKVPKVR